MIKKSISFLLSSVILVSSISANDVNNVLKKKKESKVIIKKKNVIDEAFIRKINSNFIKVTGVNRKIFDNYVKKSLNDPDYIEACKNFYFEKRDAIDANGKIIPGMRIPKYKLAYKYFYKSTVNNKNVLAAYQGLNSIISFIYQNGFMSSSYSYFKKNSSYLKYHDLYLPTFANLLLEKNYCYGYLYKTKYLLEIDKDFEKTFKISEIGTKVCKQQLEENKTTKFMEKGMRHLHAKIKVIKRSRKAREDRKKRGY